MKQTVIPQIRIHKIRIPVSPRVLNHVRPHWVSRLKGGTGMIYLWWNSQKPKLDRNGRLIGEYVHARTIVTYDFYRKMFSIPLKRGDLFRITRKDKIVRGNQKKIPPRA